MAGRAAAPLETASGGGEWSGSGMKKGGDIGTPPVHPLSARRRAFFAPARRCLALRRGIGQAWRMTQPQFTVATYNVQKGFGMDLRRNPQRTAQVIASLQADLVAVQEGDRRFGERAGVFDLGELRAAAGLVPVPVPARLGGLAHGWHGNLLLVREAEVLAVEGLHLPGAEPRGALIVDLHLAHAGPLRVIAVHLALMAQARREQARVLADLVADSARPTIVMGDMNEWRRWPSTTLSPLDAAFGQPGMAASFPSPFPRLSLDRIYVGGGLEMMSAQAHDTPLARRASDHLPVVARLKVTTRSADARQGAAPSG